MDGLRRGLKDSLLGMVEGAVQRQWCLQWVENSQRETMRRALWVELTVAANPRDKKACDIRRELQIL